jgi:hypothetical protein
MSCRWLAIAIALAAWAAPAGAQMVRAQDPQSLVKALTAAGYAAQLSTDKGGEPMITSAVNGTNFQIFFYNCTAHKDCATVQFNSGYDLSSRMDVERINDWNTHNRFGRAFLDKDRDPILQMDVDLDDGGVSPALFIDNIEFWKSILADFEVAIGYRQKA